MKKLLTVASAAAALALTGHVWAACTLDIDMGGNKINAATMTALSTSSEVATKSYVDQLMAGTPILQLSAISTTASGIAGAMAYCVGRSDDTTDRPWRLPTFDELTLAASSSSDDGGSTDQSHDLWTRTPYNSSTGRTADNDNNGDGISSGNWLTLRLSDGHWSYYAATTITYARCVR